MDYSKSFKQKLFQLDDSNFDELALEAFRFQAKNNKIYNEYIQYLDIQIDNVHSIYEIPFLPISFFKTHEVVSVQTTPQVIFESSSTTGSIPSKHLIHDTSLYANMSASIFRDFYGDITDYHIFALLPSYLERGGSSLVFMVDHLIKLSNSRFSGFFLNNYKQLHEELVEAKNDDRKIMLLGVSYALLDFIEIYPTDLSGHVIMETGGMKGRRKELIRRELHDKLTAGFNVNQIHSEYGMTELQSQAYSMGGGLFSCGKTMKVILRDMYDPCNVSSQIKQGGINVIDLTNIDSCCFVETMDIGREKGDFFEVLGRFDNSEIRGCNLMI